MKLDYPKMGKKKSKPPRTEPETIRYLERKWGMNYERNLKKAKDLLADFGSDDFIEYLENSGLGNHSTFIERLYEVSQTREAALENMTEGPLQYESMAKAEAHNINLETREALSGALSDAQSSYVEDYGTINTALPATELFIIPPE